MRKILAVAAFLLAGMSLLYAQNSTDFTGLFLRSTAVASSGGTFTLGAGTGACGTTSTLVGGPSAGSFLCTGTAGASTIVVNLPTVPAGFHAWVCSANEDTSKLAWASGAAAANSATLSGTITTTSDKVTFECGVY